MCRPHFAAFLLLVAVGCSSGGPDIEPTPLQELGREVILGREVLVHGRATVRTAAVSVEAMDHFFAPTILRGVPGARVKIALRNGGFVDHNFSVPEHGIDIRVSPGDIRMAAVVFPSSGRLPFWCSFHRESDGMIGALDAG